MAFRQQLDWSAIPLFLAVSRTGRLTVTARELGIDHSTLGRKLAGLEQSLHTKLFDRHSNGYKLTLEGQRLLQSALKMETLVIGMLSEVGGADLRVEGAVRIGAPDGFGTQFLAPRLGLLGEAYPELEVELIAMPRVFSLSKREADMAITLARPNEGRLHARKLTDYELGLYAAPGLLENLRPINTSKDLAGAPFIGYIDELIVAPELNYAPPISQMMRSVLKSSNLIAQLTASLSGAGLCILPCFIADKHEGLVRLLSEEIALFRTFWLITHSDLRELAKIRVTAEFITAQIQDNRSLFLPSHGRATAYRRRSNKAESRATGA